MVVIFGEDARYVFIFAALCLCVCPHLSRAKFAPQKASVMQMPLPREGGWHSADRCPSIELALDARPEPIPVEQHCGCSSFASSCMPRNSPSAASGSVGLVSSSTTGTSRTSYVEPLRSVGGLASVWPIIGWLVTIAVAAFFVSGWCSKPRAIRRALRPAFCVAKQWVGDLSDVFVVFPCKGGRFLVQLLVVGPFKALRSLCRNLHSARKTKLQNALILEEADLQDERGKAKPARAERAHVGIGGGSVGTLGGTGVPTASTSSCASASKQTKKRPTVITLPVADDPPALAELSPNLLDVADEPVAAVEADAAVEAAKDQKRVEEDDEGKHAKRKVAAAAKRKGASGAQPRSSSASGANATSDSAALQTLNASSARKALNEKEERVEQSQSKRTTLAAGKSVATKEKQVLPQERKVPVEPPPPPPKRPPTSEVDITKVTDLGSTAIGDTAGAPQATDSALVEDAVVAPKSAPKSKAKPSNNNVGASTSTKPGKARATQSKVTEKAEIAHVIPAVPLTPPPEAPSAPSAPPAVAPPSPPMRHSSLPPKALAVAVPATKSTATDGSSDASMSVKRLPRKVGPPPAGPAPPPPSFGFSPPPEAQKSIPHEKAEQDPIVDVVPAKLGAVAPLMRREREKLDQLAPGTGAIGAGVLPPDDGWDTGGTGGTADFAWDSQAVLQSIGFQGNVANEQNSRGTEEQPRIGLGGIVLAQSAAHGEDEEANFKAPPPQAPPPPPPSAMVKDEEADFDLDAMVQDLAGVDTFSCLFGDQDEAMLLAQVRAPPGLTEDPQEDWEKPPGLAEEPPENSSEAIEQVGSNDLGQMDAFCDVNGMYGDVGAYGVDANAAVVYGGDDGYGNAYGYEYAEIYSERYGAGSGYMDKEWAPPDSSGYMSIGMAVGTLVGDEQQLPGRPTRAQPQTHIDLLEDAFYKVDAAREALSKACEQEGEPVLSHSAPAFVPGQLWTGTQKSSFVD